MTASWQQRKFTSKKKPRYDLFFRRFVDYKENLKDFNNTVQAISVFYIEPPPETLNEELIKK